MRVAGNFHPEWGPPRPASCARSASYLVATAVGGAAGGGVVLSLVDRASYSPTMSRARHQDALASRPTGGELTVDPPMRSPIQDGMLPIVVTTR